jgi:hypothetical protein
MIQQMWKEAWTLNQIVTIPVKVKRFQETKYMSTSLSLLVIQIWIKYNHLKIKAVCITWPRTKPLLGLA